MLFQKSFSLAALVLPFKGYSHNHEYRKGGCQIFSRIQKVWEKHNVSITHHPKANPEKKKIERVFIIHGVQISF